MTGNFESRVKDVMRRGPDIDISEINVVTPQDGSDIFEALNRKLATAGDNSAVFLTPGVYTKSSGAPVETQLRTQGSNQTVFGLSSNIELADGVDTDMVDVQHDNFTLTGLTLIGNRENNNIGACVKNSNAVDNLFMDDVKVGGAQIGVHLTDVSGSTLVGCNSLADTANMDVSFKLENVNSSVVNRFVVRSFNDRGYVLENCKTVQSPSMQALITEDNNQNACVNLKGCKDCDLGGSIEDTGGFTDYGVLDETLDPGGTDETISSRNEIKYTVEGVGQIAYYIRDGRFEVIDALVEGTHDNGETNQAFLVDKPNAVSNPQHDLRLNVENVTRVTDTDIGGGNDAVTFEGKVSQVQQKSIVSFGGEGVIDVKFGEGVTNPAFGVKGGNEVKYTSEPNNTSTNGSGEVDLDWSKDYAFTDKPVISVTLEQAGQWYVSSWATNSNGRYTGATIQVTDSGGTAVGSGVATSAKVVGV